MPKQLVFILLALSSFFIDVQANATDGAQSTLKSKSWMQLAAQALQDDNSDELLKILSAESTHGNSVATFGLGLVYYNGTKDVPKDFLKSGTYFVKAAQQGYMFVRVRSDSNANQEELSTYPTLDAWLAQALSQGDSDAKTEGGSLYEIETGVSHTLIKGAAILYLKAMSTESPITQFNRGLDYASGGAVPKNYALAATCYSKAADQGYVPAAFNLALLYMNGEGVPKNIDRAILLYTKAASQGYAPAEYNLAWLYASRNGVNGDYANAVYWYMKAANQGYAAAQYNLALLYSHGLGVPKSDAEAAVWYTKAAAQYFTQAEYNLGRLYRSGDGVNQNLSEASRWFMLAAQQGYADASYQLGLDAYYRASSVNDYGVAYKWFTLAHAEATMGSQTYQGATRLLDETATQLTKTEIEQAQLNAVNLFQAHLH